jgi:hypothetical protein
MGKPMQLKLQQPKVLHNLKTSTQYPAYKKQNNNKKKYIHKHIYGLSAKQILHIFFTIHHE